MPWMENELLDTESRAEKRPLTIAVAGARGFVGSALSSSLRQTMHVVALTRGNVTNAAAGDITWKKVDVFSLLQIEEVLQGVDIAVYLIHSMLPSAELNQGSFRDYDVLAADNFARAARHCGIKQIIYLGGIIPEHEALSEHLASRKEVEAILRHTGVPVTVLRAGMVLGPGGSSMTIMRRLVKKLPLLVCPVWTAKRSQPIALQDVVACIEFVIGNENSFHQTYDIAGPSVTTYRQMMEMTARVEGLRRLFISVPLLSPGLSCLWVRLFTSAPKDLVQPLIESLRHDMLPVQSQLLHIPGRTFLDPEEALKISLQKNSSENPEPRAFSVPPDELRPKTVRSLQRMHNPSGLGAYEAAELYLRWLPKAAFPLLDVQKDGQKLFFRLRGFRHVLLILEHSLERSSTNRALFYVRGGLLSKESSNGRLEFRNVPGANSLLTAVLDFEPRLPWFLYRITQAQIHLWVMRRFSRFLAKHSRSPRAPVLPVE